VSDEDGPAFDYEKLRTKRVAQLYERPDGLYDWRRISSDNGQVVATSGGQGYADKSGAMEACSRENPGIPIEDLTLVK